MTRHERIESIKTQRIIAILRTDSSESAVAAAQLLFELGIQIVEISYTNPGTLDALAILAPELPENVTLGVGTVLETDQVRDAVERGATLIVTPTYDSAVLGEARRLGAVTICGAFSPTEAQNAHTNGADFVKIFPANVLGPGFFKAMKGPLGHIPLVAVGGINAKNIAEYLSNGAVAVAVGSSLVSEESIKAENRERLVQRAGELRAAAARIA